MRLVLLFFLSAVLCSAGSAQTREEVLEKFKELNSQAAALEKSILSPDKKDLETASREAVGVFRILPREAYDKGLFNVRGGGAFYSFTKQSHSYDDIPQISLEQNYLKVGFYGASYGFLTDLGEIPLAKIDAKMKGVNLLANYQPPLELPKARIEQERSRGFEAENVAYKNRLPAVAGHSYVVRAISYGEADVLVAFKIYRQDADGSLIIFWKLLENFEKPLLARK
jgi:hypothetical protein